MGKYNPHCPDWGPDSTHHYTNEDTGLYRPFCSCGHIDAAVSVSAAGNNYVLAVGDNPPF